MATTRMRPRLVGGLALACLVSASSQMAAAQAAPRDKLLVSAEWVKQHAADKDLVLLQIGDRKEYDAGHIPGARFASFETLSTPMNADPAALSLELPPPDELRQRIETLGVSAKSRIVVSFGSASMVAATRTILALDAAGLGDRASLLDGGQPAWQALGYPMTTDAPAVTPGKLPPLKMQDRIVDAAYLQSHLSTPGYKVVDARAAMFYDGVQAGAGGAKGHVQGAVSIPFMSVQQPDQKLKSPQELTALFASAGVSKGDHVVVYCHIGAQATAVVFAARSLGIDAKLYDGSFQDWSRRGLPVEAPAASKTP